MSWHEAETWIEEAGKRDTPLLVLEFLLHANLCDEYNLSTGTGTGTVATAFFKFFLSSAQPTKQEKNSYVQSTMHSRRFKLSNGKRWSNFLYTRT